MASSLSDRLTALGLGKYAEEEDCVTPTEPSSWQKKYGPGAAKQVSQVSPDDVTRFGRTPPATVDKREDGDVAGWIAGVKERTAMMAERAFRDVSRRTANDAAPGPAVTRPRARKEGGDGNEAPVAAEPSPKRAKVLLRNFLLGISADFEGKFEVSRANSFDFPMKIDEN